MRIHHCFLIFLYLYCQLCLAQENDTSFNVQVNITAATSDSPVQLNCSESQAVQWTYVRPGSSATKAIIATNASMYNITSSQAVGLYSCEMGNNTIQTYQAINFSVPFIPHTGQSITYTEASVDQTISCISFSYPPPTFEWSVVYDGNDTATYLLNNSNAMIIDEQSTSTVTFLSVSKSDRGVYSCNVTNAVFSSRAEILLRVRDRLAPLYPSIGIVCEIIVVIAIIYAIRRNASVNQKQFGIQFQELDSSEASHDDKNLTVRYRNVGRS